MTLEAWRLQAISSTGSLGHESTKARKLLRNSFRVFVFSWQNAFMK